MASSSEFENFDPKVHSWPIYEERLTSFMHFRKVSDEEKSDFLISKLDNDTYILLRSLITPNIPREKSYSELVASLKAHFSPTPNYLVERYRFTRRVQREGEDWSDFLADLKKLSQFCDFQASLDERIRDQFIFGLLDTYLLDKLLATKNLTLKSATDTASLYFTTRKGSQDMRSVDKANAIPLHKLHSNSATSGRVSSIQPKGKPSNVTVAGKRESISLMLARTSRISVTSVLR